MQAHGNADQPECHRYKVAEVYPVVPSHSHKQGTIEPPLPSQRKDRQRRHDPEQDQNQLSTVRH
jgi:hypothetical protein